MSGRLVWRSTLPPVFPDRCLRSWLIEPGSLTARCQRTVQHFRVRLLAFRVAQPFEDEAALLEQARSPLKMREVLLECDGVPVIFAHTLLPLAARGRLGRWLTRLGERSLGSLLFTRPGFSRQPIEFRRLDRRDPLYWRAVHAAQLQTPPPSLWARRSAHALDGQQVLVTEVFLPAILALRAA